MELYRQCPRRNKVTKVIEALFTITYEIQFGTWLRTLRLMKARGKPEGKCPGTSVPCCACTPVIWCLSTGMTRLSLPRFLEVAMFAPIGHSGLRFLLQLTLGLAARALPKKTVPLVAPTSR